MLLRLAAGTEVELSIGTKPGAAAHEWRIDDQRRIGRAALLLEHVDFPFSRGPSRNGRFVDLATSGSQTAIGDERLGRHRSSNCGRISQARGAGTEIARLSPTSRHQT